ncbi:hypothetical protein VSS74_05595 [Conexibacter stalactiti]|uniref:FHA domain-containing protein n=1 Tax=Conexibacter stalactiti TaxID=1940611 RepID=A0ABU4HM48_9ACTN|nr:hypothetical protein [Conexibacter stalactiti]MDW5593797.1 hypothetical protein [Conexibacter stalactiti]MEC5034439.1 hypothetical protein [Conexibacter stalactiti]
MGLFSRKPNPDKELASALAQRGVGGRAIVVAMRETGNVRDQVAREIEFTLDLALPDGATVRTVHRQYMNRYTLHGLAPGEPARVLYDRDDPQTLMVRGHPRFRTDVVGGEIVIVEVQDLDAG